MLTEWLSAVEQWPLAVELRNSRWTYALVNSGHIAGIALLFGAIVPLDLRLMGFWRAVPLRALARILVPVAAFGLVLAIVAGLMIFSIRAAEYAALPLFWFKMALVLCGIVNALLLRYAAQWERGLDEAGEMPPLRLRVAGALSIALWLAAIICGRMLAFVD